MPLRPEFSSTLSRKILRLDQIKSWVAFDRFTMPTIYDLPEDERSQFNERLELAIRDVADALTSGNLCARGIWYEPNRSAPRKYDPFEREGHGASQGRKTSAVWQGSEAPIRPCIWKAVGANDAVRVGHIYWDLLIDVRNDEGKSELFSCLCVRDIYCYADDVMTVWPPPRQSTGNGSDRPGQKPGQPSPKDAACIEALAILTAGTVTRGHGMRAEIGRRVLEKLKGDRLSYSLDWVNKTLRATFDDWEAEHPE